MFWNSFFADNPDVKVWDERPGGSVVDRYTTDGIDYVVVEFEQSKGQRYTFIAPNQKGGKQ